MGFVYIKLMTLVYVPSQGQVQNYFWFCLFPPSPVPPDLQPCVINYSF